MFKAQIMLSILDEWQQGKGRSLMGKEEKERGRGKAKREKRKRGKG